jgi:hypothetical protein
MEPTAVLLSPVERAAFEAAIRLRVDEIYGGRTTDAAVAVSDVLTDCRAAERDLRSVVGRDCGHGERTYNRRKVDSGSSSLLESPRAQPIPRRRSTNAPAASVVPP